MDLIYLDPPFFSNRTYEVIWGEEAEIRSFEDRWEGNVGVYVDWMRKRVVQLYRVLKSTGSIYLHCDSHASHYLKVMLDSVFGPERFRNEIVWRRTRAKGLMTTRLPNNHDVILSYQKGSVATWNERALFLPYDVGDLDPKTDSKYSLRDPEGRRYQLTSLINPNPNRPNLTYEFLGVTRTWRWTRERMQQAYEKGLVVQTRPGGVPREKRYLDEQRGQPLDDVWTDINPLNSRAGERCGWPTQKPEALLERIIELASNVNDVILDPFCGCGTSVAVAQRLQRRWIGIDISATAIEVMKRRLHTLHCRPTVINEPNSVADMKQLRPLEFRNWVIAAIFGTHASRTSAAMGIDGYSFFVNEPVQIRQIEGVNRKTVDSFETAVRRAGHSTGHMVAFSFSRGAREEALRASSDGLEIDLVTVAELLIQRKRPNGKLVPDPESTRMAPVLEMRKKPDMPTVEELIESERRNRYLESA
ncbi:DNA methyltransferase [Dactylosporangium sp. CA-092794]|uniref:DNA methyltransferase n=1 Tax=Dactylosporangium sp. CA-092794 TaxID=3239929 RepID=UPI003D93DF28